MKKLILFIFLISLNYAGATDYYVTQDGDGDPMSVAEFNALTGTGYAGDTFYFSGTIEATIDVGIKGTAGNYVTLDGYEAGDCDFLGSTCASSAYINISADYGMELDDQDYTNIQDFRFINNSSGLYTLGDAGNTNSYLNLRRLHFDTCSAKGIRLTTSNTAYKSATYLIIEECVVKDTAEGDTSSAGAAMSIYNVDDAIIRNNHLYNSPGSAITTNGADGLVVLTSNRVLIENNVIDRFSEDAIDFKDDSAITHGDVIIRYNVMHDFPKQGAITLQHESGANAYIYGNIVYGTGGSIEWYAVLVQRGFEDVFIWANVFYDTDNAGIGIYDQDGARPVDNMFIYNNTIVNSGLATDETSDRVKAGIRIDNASGGIYEIKNNILVDNNTTWAGNLNNQLSIGADAYDATTVDYNLYFTNAEDVKIHWNTSTLYTITDPVSDTTWNTASSQGANDRVGDPNFANYSSDDFTLSASSTLAIDTGVTVTEPAGDFWDPPTIQGVDYSTTVSLDLAIDPDNTDWTTIPPTVVMVDQDDHGSGWEKGAYAYPIAQSTTTSTGIAGTTTKMIAGTTTKITVQ